MNGEEFIPYKTGDFRAGNVSAIQNCNCVDEAHGATAGATSPFEFWICALAACLLLCFAGLASGLTVGILGMDKTVLHLKMQGTDEDDKRRASRILKLTHDHHRLLITLLLANTAANEALPIVLDRVVSSIAALCISIVGVLVFAEILPMSILTGPRAFSLIAKATCIVDGLNTLCCCVSLPFARLLDRIVGVSEDPGGFNRRDLKSIIELSAERPCSPSGHRNSTVGKEEGRLAVSALQFATQTVVSCTRGLNEVFMLEAEARLDQETLSQIRKESYSRIPIYRGSRDNIVGILLAKSLVGVAPLPEMSLLEWAQEAAASQAPPEDTNYVKCCPPMRLPPRVSAEGGLLDLLHQLRANQQGCQMAVVVDGYAQHGGLRDDKIIGIVTIEDVLEELLQGELEDEFDVSRKLFGPTSPLIPPAVSATVTAAFHGAGVQGSYKELTQSMEEDGSLGSSPNAASREETPLVFGKPQDVLDLT